MSQDDFIIANQGFPAFRSDLNSNLQALASTSSGATAPSTTYANQLWYDTANDILKIRNEANSAWINVITLDQTNNKNSSITVPTIDSGTSTALTLKSGTTTAMTIDTSQNVGIGTSSINASLQVHRPAGSASSAYFTNGTTTTSSGFQVGLDSGNNAILNMQYNAQMLFSTNNAERMRIDSSGNVGIGTTSPSYKLQVASGNANISDSTATQRLLRISNSAGATEYQIQPDGSTRVYNDSYITWTTGGGSERMRIDSSGNLLVGTTSGAGRLRVERSDNLDVAYFVNTNASFNQDTVRVEASRAATNAYNLFRGMANSVNQFLVTGNGVIYAQNTTIQSLSDIRTKENIRESTEGLNVISALRPVRFDFKEGFGNNRKNELGFIAQEVEQVFPDAINEWEQGGEVYKSLGPAALIPVLVKAIQELKAELDALKGTK